MMNELNTANLLILKCFEPGLGNLMCIPGLNYLAKRRA
jgi:hypothetical protein